MYIANNETTVYNSGILNFMPRTLRRYMYGINLSNAYEIRMRLGKSFMICYPDGHFFLNRRGILTPDSADTIKITRGHIDEALELAVKSSMYSSEDEIRNGYITIEGGNRIGICGKSVISNGKISFLKDISGLNYRLAREVIGAADKITDCILTGSTVKNTLIISPPGAGKTTLLRDIARQLSLCRFNVSVADERGEIAAAHEGKSAFDMGPCTDILSGAPKSESMLMLLRSMAPDVIITDEIGTTSDVKALEKIINSGVKIITSVHGSGIEQLRQRKELSEVMHFFAAFIVLSKRHGAGTIEKIEICG